MCNNNNSNNSILQKIYNNKINKHNITQKRKRKKEHYGTAPVDPCRPQNRGSHHYLRAHKGSRRLSRPLIQDSSVRVLFP